MIIRKQLYGDENKDLGQQIFEGPGSCRICSPNVFGQQSS